MSPHVSVTQLVMITLTLMVFLITNSCIFLQWLLVDELDSSLAFVGVVSSQVM